jgi:exonuclease I
MLHTSGMYPAILSCTRLCTVLAYHPEYNDRAIVFNLDQDPSLLFIWYKHWAFIENQVFNLQSFYPFW